MTKREREISGQIYTVQSCDRCHGTGYRFDITQADKINAGPYAGRCASCTHGETFTLRPAIDVAHAMALETHTLILDRQTQEISEIPDWMC